MSAEWEMAGRSSPYDRGDRQQGVDTSSSVGIGNEPTIVCSSSATGTPPTGCERYRRLVKLRRCSKSTADPAKRSEAIPINRIDKTLFLIAAFSCCNYQQDTEFLLEGEATLLAWDAFSAGRVVRGERFAFDKLSNRTQVFRDGLPEVVDGFEFLPGDEPFGGY